jgi:hypothetical protein
VTASYLASPAPAAPGDLCVTVSGIQATLRASGGLWLAARGVLVVADLHLEKGSAYAARGQMLPPYDTRDTLRRLEAEIAVLAPKSVVLLGDTFHDRRAEDRLAGDDADRLRGLADRSRLIWVVGNHDADGPRALPGEVVDEWRLDDLILRHEPQAGRQPGEVSGHLHPCAKIQASRGRVRRRCFVTDSERLILPAFGAYAGGLNVRDPAFSGLFAERPIIGALGSDRVHAIGWRSLLED